MCLASFAYVYQPLSCNKKKKKNQFPLANDWIRIASIDNYQIHMINSSFVITLKYDYPNSKLNILLKKKTEQNLRWNVNFLIVQQPPMYQLQARDCRVPIAHNKTPNDYLIHQILEEAKLSSISYRRLVLFFWCK